MVFGEVGTHHRPSRSSSLRQHSIARGPVGRRWRMCCCRSRRAPATAITLSTPIVRPQSLRREEVETLREDRPHCGIARLDLSDVGYGPMTGNASADVAAHQFAKGDPGYQLQAGDAYFREGPFIYDFPEISPSALLGLALGGDNATSFGSLGAPYCKPSNVPGSADIAQ